MEQKINNPVLLGIIDPIWLEDIKKYFSSGKNELYIATDASNRYRDRKSIKKVYFKINGTDCASFEADFIGFTDENIIESRLYGPQSDHGNLYYGFKNFKKLEKDILLDQMENANTWKVIRKNQQTPVIVNINL